MPDRRNDLAQVKALLQDRIEELARDLVPEGRRSGKYWIARNPTREDRKAGSFWIALRGVPGSWRDEATGEKGDVIQLIAYIRRTEFGDTMRFARGWLGIADMPPEKVAEISQLARNKRREAQAREEDEEKDRRARAMGWWLAAGPIAGSVAETYLAARGIDLSKLKRFPSALRFADSAFHRESGERFPCILAAMSGPGGPIQAVHRTFLARDGSGKAPVEPARKMWPRSLGASIHLWRGVSDKPAAQAPKGSDVLVICEGIEDGLSIALARPDYRVWCAGSLGNVGNLKIPACAARVIVAADNDWGKPQAERLLAQGLAALSKQGAPVFVAHSPIGKDFNDCLRGVAA